MAEEKAIVDEEVFRTFFRESYCTVDYAMVKEEFEEVAEGGLSALYAEDTDFSKVNEKTFIVYMRGDAYTEFETIVEETFDALNPEILDAVMDVSTTMEDCDEITEIYWETKSDLLKTFLRTLYSQKIKQMIEER